MITKQMISKQSLSGVFFTAGLYLAYSNWLIPSIVSMFGALLILKAKNKSCDFISSDDAMPLQGQEERRQGSKESV